MKASSKSHTFSKGKPKGNANSKKGQFNDKFHGKADKKMKNKSSFSGRERKKKTQRKK